MAKQGSSLNGSRGRLLGGSSICGQQEEPSPASVRASLEPKVPPSKRQRTTQDWDPQEATKPWIQVKRAPASMQPCAANQGQCSTPTSRRSRARRGISVSPSITKSGGRRAKEQGHQAFSLATDSKCREVREQLRYALDSALDACCDPVLKDLEKALASAAVGREGITISDAGAPRRSLAELATEICGLADVRGFVDEQLTADLGVRTRACGNLARASLDRIRGRDAVLGGARALPNIKGSLEPVSESSKLALKPFRSCSQYRSRSQSRNVRRY